MIKRILNVRVSRHKLKSLESELTFIHCALVSQGTFQSRYSHGSWDYERTESVGCVREDQWVDDVPRETYHIETSNEMT